MDLICCDAPSGALERAPRTALRRDTATELWDGFWADDDRYYARCTHSDGSVDWFRLEDRRRDSLTPPRALPRVIAGPRRRATSFALLARASGGRRVLVGRNRPKPR